MTYSGPSPLSPFGLTLLRSSFADVRFRERLATKLMQCGNRDSHTNQPTFSFRWFCMPNSNPIYNVIIILFTIVP